MLTPPPPLLTCPSILRAPYLEEIDRKRSRDRHQELLRLRRREHPSLLGHEAVHALDPDDRIPGPQIVEKIPFQT